MDEAQKQAEIDYPDRVGEDGRGWLHRKPFGAPPQLTARYLIDFAHVVALLSIEPGVRFLELGCGSGWMTRFAARCGADAVGVDISPAMIEIAREEAGREQVAVRFEVGDMEGYTTDERFDRCLIYDALHHTPRAQSVLACVRRALRPGGQVLIVEPNWKHRFQGRAATREFGTTELGYSARRFKQMMRTVGFVDLQRFHNERKRLYGNRPREVVEHLAEPLVYRTLGPLWTQVWVRGVRP